MVHFKLFEKYSTYGVDVKWSQKKQKILQACDYQAIGPTSLDPSECPSAVRTGCQTTHSLVKGLWSVGAHKHPNECEL